jgi:curved DNA-binding protein
VPKGTLPGQQLRMAGQGQSGPRGGDPGDLLLEITLQPDARYRVDGRNVTATLPIAPWEAALGADIEVPTPSGQVRVKIPPGSQAGRKLRLKGRGLPSHPPGDLYLKLSIVVPPANTPQARAMYEAMARELAFDPRAQGRA